MKPTEKKIIVKPAPKIHKKNFEKLIAYLEKQK